MRVHEEMLLSVPWFQDLSEIERRHLAERIDVRSAKTGELLFQQGDPGGVLYLLVEGSVELFSTTDEGDRIVFETVNSGGFFGEISLVDGGTCSSSAVALTDLEAVLVDREDLQQLFELRPTAAMVILSAVGARLRLATHTLRHAISRNTNIEEEDRRTWVMKVADAISAFSGSLEFLFLHVFIFAIWIGLNIGSFKDSALGGFDPFPFGLLTMVVSLEAIFLSVFVLLSQNRQAARERVRNDIEYHINLKAELEIAELHKKVDDVSERVLSRLERIEQGLNK